jgi:hypothetical protein
MTARSSGAWGPAAPRDWVKLTRSARAVKAR